MFYRSIAAYLSLLVLTGCVQPEEPKFDFEAEALKRGAEKVAACQLSECTRLDLDGAYLEDFSVLNDMPHVTKLMMSRSNITDLGAIAGMTQLKELHISWTDLEDLSGLAAFSRLELLHANDLYQNPDYAPVYKMRALKELSLDARTDDGLGFVKNMRGLRALYLMRGEVDDLSPLAGNRSIQEFVSDAILPEDKTPILRMRGLKRFESNDWQVDEDLSNQLKSKGVEVAIILTPVVC